MADYAEECGNDVGDSELEDCLTEQAEAEEQQLQLCGDFGDARSIRLEWTCDDVDAYWSGG